MGRVLLDELWRRESPETRAFLIALMKNMNLICNWNDGSGQEQYVVPSLFEWNALLCTMPGNDRAVK